MRAVALVRYLAADALRSGRWVAPMVLFAVVTVSGTAVGGAAIGGFGLTATVLMPVSSWLAVAVLNSEDPTQTTVTAVTAGGVGVVRTAALAVAFAGAQALTAFAVLYPIITGHPATGGDVAAGVVAHLLTSLAGVAVGSLLARPLLMTPTWAVLAGVGAFLAEILVPGAAPVRPIALAFTDDRDPTVSLAAVLTVAGLETVVGAALLVIAANALTRRAT